MAKKSAKSTKSEHPKKPDFIIDLTPDKYQTMITENELIVIDFNATWCPPCRTQEKEFTINGKELFVKFPNLKLCSMNVDEDKGISDKLGIQYVPNMFIYYKGVYTALEPHGYYVKDLIPLIEKHIQDTEEKIKKNPNYLEETRKIQFIKIKL